MSLNAEAQVQKRKLDEAFVVYAWQQAFGRSVDENGRREVLYRLDRGHSRLLVIEDLLTSEEYALRERDNAGFTQDLYGLVLGRQPHSGDDVAAWQQLVETHGREFAFRAFSSGPEAGYRYSHEDSYDIGDGPSGTVLVTFRRETVLVTFGRERVASPLTVTRDSFLPLVQVLEMAGFELLGGRIRQHLTAPLVSHWKPFQV